MTLSDRPNPADGLHLELAEVERLREALREIVASPPVTFVGEGRDRRALIDGHQRAVAIAQRALDEEEVDAG